MAIRVKVDATEVLRKISQTQQTLEREDLAGALQVMGVALLGLVKLNFERLSKGGEGAGGVRWDPLKPETIKRKNRKAKTKAGRASKKSQINVDRGLLRNSATPGFTSAEGGNILDVDESKLAVTVGYGMDYAEFVDEKRELIPDPLPDDWVEEIEDTLTDWAEDHFTQEF